MNHVLRLVGLMLVLVASQNKTLLAQIPDASYVRPRVVAISVEYNDGQDWIPVKEGKGTGFLIHPDGYVLTAKHLAPNSLISDSAQWSSLKLRGRIGNPESQKVPLEIESVHPSRDVMLLRFKDRKEVESNFFTLTDRFALPIMQVSAVGFPASEGATMKVVTAFMRSDVVQGVQHGEVNSRLKGGFSGSPVVFGREVIGLVESSSAKADEATYKFIPIRSIKPWIAEHLELQAVGITDREAAEISRIIELVNEYQQSVKRDYKDSKRALLASPLTAIVAFFGNNNEELDELVDELKANRDRKIRQLPAALYTRIALASKVLLPRVKILTNNELKLSSRARGKLLTELVELQVDLAPLKGKEIFKDVYFFQYGRESELPQSIALAGVESPAFNPARRLHLQLNDISNYQQELKEASTDSEGLMKISLHAKKYEDALELVRLIQTYGIDDETKEGIGFRLQMWAIFGVDFTPFKGTGVFNSAIISGRSKKEFLELNPTLSGIDMSQTVFRSSH